MSNDLFINVSNVRKSVEEYHQMQKILSQYVEDLETIKTELSGYSYGEIKRVIELAVKEQREHIGSLKEMGNTLSDITKCYEDAEKRISNAIIGEKDIKKISQEVEETLKKIIDDIIKMLKGWKKQNCKYGGDPINFSTGNFVYQREYLKLKGLFPLFFRMTYNSIEQQAGVMGKGWVHNYQVNLEQIKERVILHWSDGGEDIYIKDGKGKYKHFFGKNDILSQTSDGFIYETVFGVKYFFDKRGINIKILDCNENVLSLLYDAEERLIEIRSVSGEALFYQYDENGMLIQVSDSENRSIQLIYESNQLIQVKDEENNVFQYSYDSDGKLCKIVNGRNIQTIENEYDALGRVIKQSYPDGGNIQIEYDEKSNVLHVTEQNGNKIDYVHDEHMRSVETIYADGKLQYAYNDKNQRIEKIDKKGNKTKYGYDDAGNLCRIENPLGEIMEMEYNIMKQVKKIMICGEMFQENQYDDKGNLILRKDAIGRETHIHYNENGKPVEIEQPDGSVIELTYDIHGNITSIKEPLGGKISYEYDGLGRVVATIDGNGNRTEYTYNRKGYIVSVKNAEGNEKHYHYNESSKITCVEDYDGSCVYREYNDINRVSRITNQDGIVTTLEYDNMYNVSRRVEANGAESRFIYNRLNRLERMINPKGAQVCYEYDANGNRTKIVDSEGGTVNLKYDALNRLVAVEDADGSVSYMEYNQFGQRVKMTDAMGGIRRVIYNAAGQKIRTIDVDGNEIKYSYDLMGNISEVVNAEGQKITYKYLPGGLLDRITYANGTFICYTYDANRNVKTKRNQDGLTIFYTYDSMNRIIKIESSEGQKKIFTYDAVGNVKTMTDANGNTTRYQYSPTRKVTTVTDALGNCTEYKYNEMGSLTDVYQYDSKELGEVLELNNKHSKKYFIHYDRNILGQIETVRDALQQEERYSYSDNGWIIEKIDKDGLSTKYDYTKGGQISKIQYDDGKSVQFSYNALKQLTEIKDWLGITTIEVDELGRTKKVRDYEGREVEYFRDKSKHQFCMQYPNGKMVQYKYDEFRRLIALCDEEDVIQYNYDKSGRLMEKILPNGIRTNYSYFATGMLAGICHCDEEGIIDSCEYKYDLVGNKIEAKHRRRGMLEESGIYNYVYDRMNRLISVDKNGNRLRSYGYDSAGNRSFVESENCRTDYYYNEINQMIQSVNGETVIDYEYDNRGNLIRVMGNGELKHEYAYNGMNRLECAANDAGEFSVYKYNGLGQRVIQQIYESRSIQDVGCMLQRKEYNNLIKTTEYILDYTKHYNNLLLEKQNDNYVREYIWDGNIVADREREKRHYYLQDELGNPLRYLDDEGQIIENYCFDEFGNDLIQAKERCQPFGYAGFYKDEISGTYNAKAREYMPTAGRFASRDIVKGIQAAPYTMNEYTYCWNRPLMFVDRDGAFPSIADVTETAVGGIFNTADYVWDNYIPEDIQGTITDGFSGFVESGRDFIEQENAFGYSISDYLAMATESYPGEVFLEAFSFDRTSDGVYHANQNCWQEPFGYNDFYDYVFASATDMDKRKYSFTTADGTEYTVWMWKGDYLNLGAGCETGIYYGDKGEYHKDSGSDTNLNMHISLYDKNTGKEIFSYCPEDPQWWVTGFNPKYQDYEADDLAVHGCIDFSKNEELWKAFYDEYAVKEGWCFDEENKVAYYEW